MKPMNFVTVLLLMMPFTMMITGCKNTVSPVAVRQPVDTIGFATHSWQTDSVLARIERLQAVELNEAAALFDPSEALRMAISPHDDYTYVGYLYPALLQHVKSDVVILFGVGHKAKSFGLEDKIVFGSYSRWKSPGGEIRVSDLQQSILKRLPGEMYVVHDSLQAAEHSLEALIPFLEHYNPDVEIIPVIIPCMPFERMEAIADALAPAIRQTMDEASLAWGRGWSIVISTDAVHYGNEDWGGSNYDRFGADTAGYIKAVEYEKQIMNTMLAGELTTAKIRQFSESTVMDDDYRQYKWTWCGRYAVPLGLLTAYRISEFEEAPLTGISVGYSTSIADCPVPVSDLGMGVTAPTKLTHWVGYAAVGYR